MNKIRDIKGITLIALIITIIVLLILAGVTIAAITGNESAPNKAVEARTKNEEGAAKDAATLLVEGKIQSYYEEKYVDRTSNAGTVLDYLTSELSSENNVTTDGYKIVVAGGKITVTKTGESKAFVRGTVSKNGVISWGENIPGLDNNGNFTSWDDLIADGTITVSNGKIISVDSDKIIGELSISNEVTSIGNGAFACCEITSIIIPDGVISIEEEAFLMSELTSITIPSSVTSIGDWAFYWIGDFVTVNYTGTEEQWNSINIGIGNTDLTNAEIQYNYGSGN